jgi:hypothetical protein
MYLTGQSHDVPKRVMRYYKHLLPFAMKSRRVQDRYNDDIHQDICCSYTIVDGGVPNATPEVDQYLSIPGSNFTKSFNF